MNPNKEINTLINCKYLSQLEISRLTMTGAEQGTIDSNNGGYLSKASNFGPAIFKAAELVRIIRIRIDPHLFLDG